MWGVSNNRLLWGWVKCVVGWLRDIYGEVREWVNVRVFVIGYYKGGGIVGWEDGIGVVDLNDGVV